MTVQLIIANTPIEAVIDRIGEIAPLCEIFPMDGGRVGLSIPTKIVSSIEEGTILEKLDRLIFYDLYSGKWIDKR
jgi:hypothetical protein